MGFLDQIDAPERRTDTRLCPHCEATPAACRSADWLRGRPCCERCRRNHDEARS